MRQASDTRSLLFPHLLPTTYHLPSKGIELGVLLGGGAARAGGMLGIQARGGEQRGRKLG